MLCSWAKRIVRLIPVRMRRRWLEPVARDGLRRLRYRRSVVCTALRWPDGRQRSCLPQGRGLFDEYPGGRRVVARKITLHLVAAVPGKRIPLWARSVHLYGRNRLGDARVDCCSRTCERIATTIVFIAREIARARAAVRGHSLAHSDSSTVCGQPDAEDPGISYPSEADRVWDPL